MQASMNEFVQLLEGRDDSVHQSTGNEELMEPRSPTGPEDSRALSKQLDDSNKLPPPSDIDELVFGFLGLSEAQQNTAATSLCLVRDVVPSGRSAFKPSEPKTYLIDGTSESYGGNWDEGLLENDYDYSCLSSCAHEVVITTEMQSSGTGDKDTADRLVANANEYSLDVLAQEKLDVQDFQVEEALHMASAPNVMCKRGIDPLQEDSTFFEDMGFDMRNSSEINAEGSSEDVSPACSNLHIVPMSDGMMEVSSSPPEEFAVPLSRDSGVEIGKAASPDVAKVPVSAEVGQSSQTCQAVASTSQRPVFDLTSCCGPIGAVVKNQIVLPYSGDTILSESDSVDSQDFGMPKLVRADDPPQPAADHVYDTPPELEPVDQLSSTANKKGVKTTTSTLASAAGEDILKASKKITLGVVPETIQEATSQEELNDSLGKIVPSFTPDMSNQMPAYMNDIYDVGNISLDTTCCNPTTNAASGSSLPLLPCTEEPKVYKTFEKTPPKKTKAPVVKTKDSCGVDKGFIRDLLRSVNGVPNKLSGPNCVVEFTNLPLAKPIIRKKVFDGSSNTQEKQMDSTRSGNVMGNSSLNTFAMTTTKNVCPASGKPKNIPVVVKASSLELDFKSLPDLPTLLDIGDIQLTDTVPSNCLPREGNPVISNPPKRLSSSENLSGSRGKLVPNHSNKAGSIIQISKKAETPSNPPGVDVPSNPSPTFLNKTTAIIPNVAQGVVCGIKVPQTDEIKSKKSVPVETQDKPLACTSAKALTPPQELKVSLPISSLDLSSVKIVGVGSKENANVITGIPTMAQRKQYVDVTSLAVVSTKRSTKNMPVISNNHIVSDVLSPNKPLDGFSKSKVLSKDMMGVLNELTVCSEALMNTLNSGKSTVNVTLTDVAGVAKGLKHVDNNTKNISIEPNEITSTSKPICRLSSGQSIENMSSQIEDTVGAPKKSVSSSKQPTGPLGSDEMEQTEVLKEHPVVAIVNSLIQSASKLPDSFEETREQLEGSTDVASDERKNTVISKDVTVKEKLSEVVDKLEAKSRSSDANQTHKPSADVAHERKSTEKKLKVTVPRDEVEKDQTSTPDKEKTNTCSSEIVAEKLDTSTSRESSGQALTEVVIKDPDQASNSADKQKPQSVQEVTDEQKLLTQKIVEKRKTRLSQDSTKRTVDAALLDDAKNRKSEVRDSKACLPEKTISPSDSLDKPKKSATESSSAVNPVLADPNQKLKTPVTQDTVKKSKTALSEVVISRTKLALSQVVVVETKPTALETTVVRSKRAKDQAKPSQSQKEVAQKKSPPVVVDKPKDMPKSVLNSTMNVIPKPVAEATKITVPQDFNSLKPLEKATTQTTKDMERKPAVEKLKPSPSNVGAKESKTTSSHGKATKSNGEVSDILEKGSTQNMREESLRNKGIQLERVVTEKKPVVDKAKAVVSNVADDKTKTSVPEKLKRKAEVSIVKENSNISRDAEVKNNCVSMTELGKTDEIRKTETLLQTGGDFKETAEEVQKGSVQSAHEVVVTGKRLCTRKKGDEKKSIVENSMISSSKVLTDTPLKASPSDVAEQPIESVQNILVKDDTQTLEKLVSLKKGSHAKQGEDKKHVDDKQKMKSSKAVVDVAKTSILRDVVDKLREKVESTLLNQSTATSLTVTEKKTSAQSGEVDVEKKAVEDQPKSVVSVMDDMKLNEPRQVTEKPLEKIQDITKEVSTKAQVTEKPLEKIQDITKEVSTKALSNDVEKNRTMIPPQPKKVANKRKSASKEICQKQVTTSLEDLVQKSVVLTLPDGVDGQKPSTEGNTNIMGLKKSKSSDILIEVVKTRTTKMVNEACNVPPESVNSKRDSLKDKAKKPSLGHWRIVKHDKETAGAENSMVSQPEKIDKVTREVEEESKTRLRKRGEVPPAKKLSVETNLDQSSESVPAAGAPKPPVSVEEEQGKLTAGTPKSAVSLEEEQGKRKAGALKSPVSLEEEQRKLTVETTNKDENKTRLRTRSETSIERKMKDDGSSLAVGSDKQVIANPPKQVVISNRNGTKQTTESVDTSVSNKTSVRQIRKTSVDRKPLAQPTVPETVVQNNKLCSKSRSETSNEKKVKDNKNSAGQMSENGSKESNGNVGVLPITGQNVESAVSEDVMCIDGKLSSATAVIDQVHEESNNRLRTRSETSYEKKVDNSLSVGTEDQVGPSESLAKRVVPLDKNLSKSTKDITNVELKSPPHEGNKLRQTRSDTSIEKKLKKAETSSPLTNQPVNTELIPKSNLVGKTSVNDVYDFTEDEVQSNIRTIDQFRTLSGKSMKNKRTSSVSGALESSVVELENKLNSSTRKSRSESTKASGRNSRKASPRKNPVKKEAVVSDKITKGNICDQKLSIPPEAVNAEGGKDSVSLSSDNRSEAKEVIAARSRSKDLGNEEVTVSPTRVLRSKVKHTVPNDITNHIVDSEIDSKQAGSTPLEVTSDNNFKGTFKTLDNKQEPSSEKCDSTTMGTTSKYESTLPAAEDVETSLNRRKTRSSVKLTPKMIENSSQETSPSSNDNLLLPKLRSSVSRKLNGSPLTVTSEVASVDSNLKQFTYNNSVDDDGSLSDTVSLKSEIAGDELKLTIKRIKKTVQSDKADISIASESHIVQKSIRETPCVDNISNDKIKAGKTSIAELEVLSNQSTMLSAQDTAVCNAEAVSLKTPPMGSVVTPEPDNIQAVDDMPQQREPEGAKSSTRTAQLRSLVSLQGADCNGREHVSFHGDKGRVERKRLARERSILSKKSIQPILEDLKNKPQNSIVDVQLSVDIGKQPSHFSIHGSSRNSSPAKTPKSSIENPSAKGNTGSDKEDAHCRRITRSSLSSATDSLVKSSLKDDFEKDCSKPKRGANSPNVGSSTLKPNTHESSGSKNKKVSKEADKQLGKRPQGEFESRQTIHDEVPVRPKLRKIETSPTVNSIESGIKSENPKIMTSVPCKGSSNPDKKTLLPKGGISKSIIEPPEIVEATCKIPGSTDKVSVVKENTKKDIVAPKLSTPQDSASKNDGSSKTDPLAEPHEGATESVKLRKSEKGPGSRRKSKIAPPTKIVSSDVAVRLTEGKEKTSVKDVCLASESLDKILREEDIKEVPSSFDVLAQSPGKSPDSTTQSRVDMVISKLAQEPLIVNSRKISEDSQGVTSTTEIESVPIIVEKPPSPLVREKQSHTVGKGKKEDEGVSSTTVDSKLSGIPYSDTKYVDFKKKGEVKASPHSKQSANKTTADSQQQSLGEQTRKESLVPSAKSPVPPQSAVKMIPESPSKLLKRSDIQTITSKIQSSSGLGGCGNDDTAPEYDVLHPRLKIWRVADLNKILNEENVVNVQASCRVNETSNHKTLSDEKLKRTPLKKRQVWGIQLHDKDLDESSRNEEKKTPEKLDNSPTSSVDQLPHSIYNILSVGPGDVTQTIQEADSRSGSKEGAASSLLSTLKRKGYIKYRKSLKKVKFRHLKKKPSITRSSCRWRRGSQRSRLLQSFPKRNRAIKVKKPSKKLKNIKPLRKTCNEPEIVEVAQSTDLATQKTSDATEVVETVRTQPKLIQNEPVKPNLSKPSLLLGDTVPAVTIQSSLPAVHNYKELTVDLTEDEEASPQYSPLRPRDQDSVSQELPTPVHSNFSGGFTPVAPKWTKQSCSGGLIVPSSTNVGPFIVSPQATPVPRPIMERSRSFSSLGQTSKPRARRESHPALRHAVQSSAPVDLSFHSKKSRSDSSSSHRIVNPEGLVIPNNIGKLDLFGQNPTFSTSLHGDVVTFDLAQNQVVCMKPTSIPCMNRPIEAVPSMNVPMSDQLNTPIRPIPLSNHKDRPAPISAYPPLSGNNVKDLMPATKSSFNDFSNLYQQPLSAFHAMKNNNASISHGTRIMLSPVDVSKMSLCPSTSPSNGRMKSIHLKRAKGDVSCPSSSKVNFTNPIFHEDVRRSTDVRAVKMMSQQPLFNENESGRLPYCSSDSYKLGYMKNTNPQLLPSTLNTSVLPVASRRSYQTEKGRSDQSLIERHQQALQKVVREFNDGMNSIKDSNSFSNIQEATKPSLDRSSDNTSVKMVNFPKCSESVPIPDVIPSFIVTAPKPISNAVDLGDQFCTDDISKRVHCNATPPKQMKVPEEVHAPRLVETPVIVEEAAKSEVASQPSISKTTPRGNEPIKSPDNVLKMSKVSDGCSITSNESCTSSDPSQCVVSPPTSDSKAAGDQVAKDLPEKTEERVEEKSGEKQDIIVAEIEESSDNPSPDTPVVSEEFKLDSQLINATSEGNETIKNDSATTETQDSSDQEHGSKPAGVLLETISVQLDETLETKIHVVMPIETMNDEMPTTSEQPLPSLDTLTKSKIELPIESSELVLNENPIEPVASEISPSTTPSSLTPILQNLELPSNQLAPEKDDTCTDHSLPEVSCQDVTSDLTINEADVKTTKPQPQEMEQQMNSEEVSAISIGEESSVIPNPVQSSECKEILFDVSDKLPEVAGDNSVPSDSTGGAIINSSLVSLEPISNLNPTNPFESKESCNKVDNPIEFNQSQEVSEESSEVPDHNLSTAQASCNVGEQDHVVSNDGLNPLSIVSDHLGTASSFDTPLPSPSPTNEVIIQLNTPTETAVPSSANESSILVTAPDSNSPSNVLMSSNSNWNGDSPVRETESVDKGMNINVSTFPNARKRKLPPDSDDEEVHSTSSIDSSTCLIEKCKKVEAKVKIRPISPTTVDQIVRLGIKINPTELQDIVRCWQEFNRSSERATQNQNVGRADSVATTTDVGGSQRLSNVNITEPRKSPVRSGRFEDPISRPSTSRKTGVQPPSPLNRYLLEREVIRYSLLRKKSQKRTCVRETFARGIKIHQRVIGVKTCGVDAFTSSTKRPSSISDFVSAVTPIRPIDRSYSRILEYLRETRKTIDTESIIIQSCKDFIKGVSKDAVPSCQVNTSNTLPVGSHSRVHSSDGPTPVTNRSPTTLGATTTVISSESEDSNGGDHVMKDRAEVRKRSRRKVSSFVKVCSCPSSSHNHSSNVCPTCGKARNRAQGASSPVHSSNAPLYTEVSNMQRRESERIMKCAAAGGGEENVIVPDSITVDLLKALASLAGRRPTSSVTPVTTYSSPCSLTCDEPVPSSRSEVFSLPYEKDLLSPRVTVVPDPPLHDASLPPPVPETTRGSSTRCSEQKLAYEEAPCLLEGNDVNLQQRRELVARSQVASSSEILSSTSCRHLEIVDKRHEPYNSRSASQSQSSDKFRVPLTQQASPADNDTLSTPNPAEEATRLLSRIGKLITPDVLEEIQRLLPNMDLLRPSADPSEEPPLKKRKE